MWLHTLTGVRQFLQKYDSEEVGLRFDFEILVVSNTGGLDAQSAVGKGFLDLV